MRSGTGLEILIIGSLSPSGLEEQNKASTFFIALSMWMVPQMSSISCWPAFFVWTAALGYGAESSSLESIEGL